VDDSDSSPRAPTVRPARPEDAPTIGKIWYLAWLDGHLGNVPEELVELRTEEAFVPRAADRVPHTTVALVGGEIAGFVTVEGDEVEQVFLSASHRGAGVADLLLAEGERQIRAAGHQTAWLAVVAGNARARRFYERCGWSDAGPFDYEADGDGGPIVVPSHRYEKNVG
jgi:GNAT superfamily N-acetyltransferase